MCTRGREVAAARCPDPGGGPGYENCPPLDALPKPVHDRGPYPGSRRDAQGGRDTVRMDTHAVIAELQLEPHPEGGFYRQTWADEHSTAIYYLLPGSEWSAWHRVRDRVELWHFYVGSPLELSIGMQATQTVELGVDLSNGQRPQAVVPASEWQRARSLGGWSLVGCTVTPPFTFDAFDVG